MIIKNLLLVTYRFLQILLILPWLLVKLGSIPFKIASLLLQAISLSFHSLLLWALKIKGSFFIMPKKSKKNYKNKSNIFKKWDKWLLKHLPTTFKASVALTVVAILIFFYSLFLVNIATQLPSPEQLKESRTPLTSEFYDRNGTLLYRLYQDKNRSLIKLEDLPPYLLEATLAIEDKNFYKHPGIDIVAMGRAVMAYLKDHQVQGASTITQQLIKNTMLSPERTWQRKLREIVLAFWTEKVFSKKEILQMYFNEVPYGGSSWGIASAAQTIFGKDVKDLTLAESAYLAGLPASPTTFSPYGTNPELGKNRQKEVLRRMVEEGYITKDQARTAAEEPLKIQKPVESIRAPHFVMYIKQVLVERYGERVVSQGGLKVITSLDLNIQDMAEEVVSEEVEKLKGLQVSNGAAMITDVKTGQILAMVGSKDYFDPKEGNFNVTTALRQPGSSIKPITYATGFKQGYSPGTIVLDTPVSFKNAWEVYSPVNYDGRFHGPVSIRTALGSSYNIPAVKVLSFVGIPSMIQTAHDMGITTLNDKNRYGLSLTLGGGEVKLIDMMGVYGTLADMGVKKTPQGIIKIANAQGAVLEDNERNMEKEQAIPQGIAFMISDILADNNARTPAFGPNSLLKIPGHTVAVKTGTTDSKRDNWTFGYTPEYVVGVWVGNNNNSPMNPSLTSGVTGAAPIWNKLMTNLLIDKPDIKFKRPTDIVEAMVDGHKDLIIKGQNIKSAVGYGRKTVQENGGEAKETITFTDPFSTYTLDQKPPTP